MAKGVRSAYVYLDHEIDDPADGPQPWMAVCDVSDRCLLSFEIENAGLPKYWSEDLAKYPPGYYLVRYDTGTESEGEYGEIHYQVVEGLVSIEPSRKAHALWIWHRQILPALDRFTGLFRKIWNVDFEYGAVGITSGPRYLPHAAFIRFFTPKGHAAWGDNYTRRELNRR